mgnify:CR=1 FL=1
MSYKSVTVLGETMIELTKINGKKFYVNADLMEFLEATPDTIISLTTGKKIIVKENVEEVIELVIQYKSKALRNWEILTNERT